jgi:hypothetical protein
MRMAHGFKIPNPKQVEPSFCAITRGFAVCDLEFGFFPGICVLEIGIFTLVSGMRLVTPLCPSPLEDLGVRFQRIAKKSLWIDSLRRIMWTGVDATRDGQLRA